MSETEPAAAPPAAPAPAALPESSRAPRLALIAVILATALTALFWVDVRNRIGGTQEELARRLQDIDAGSREARAVARQSQEALRDAQARITPVSYTHLRAHETPEHLVCRLLLE